VEKRKSEQTKVARHLLGAAFLGICSSPKRCSLPHGQTGQKTGEGPLLRCRVLRYNC